MNDIRLTLSVAEINLALKALGNLPYYQVCTLIEKMQAQANLQLTHLNDTNAAGEKLVPENQTI
jgi:hypothetical protein